MKDLYAGNHTLRQVMNAYTETWNRIDKDTDWEVMIGSNHHPNDPSGYETPYDFSRDFEQLDVRFLLKEVSDTYYPDEDYTEDYVWNETWDYILNKLRDYSGLDVKYDWFN